MLFSLPAVVLAFAPSLKPSDEVTALPGWDAPLPSKQYSGYLAVGEHKQLHYWLVEAENAPDSAPLVLWLNGGPGCSSLDGFIYEHGPFRTDPEDPTKLVRFKHTWVQHAHMLYLEAPAGVGFSYSTDAADYQTNDDQTASDSAEGMQAFFAAFPRYRKHAFFIAGESYAGVYVPTLAEAILSLVDRGAWEGAELKGIAVGNGCSGTEVGVCGGQRWAYDTTYLIGTALVDPQLKALIVAQCDFTAAAPSSVCAALIDQMSAAIDHVNLYNIYGECITGQADKGQAQQNKIPYARDFLGASRTRVGGPDACINSIAGSAYFNQASGPPPPRPPRRRLASRRPRLLAAAPLDLPPLLPLPPRLPFLCPLPLLKWTQPVLVAARSRPSSRLRTSRGSPSSGRRAATRSNTPRRGRTSRAIPTLRSSSGCASSFTMATGTRVFRTLTVRRGRAGWALLRRHPGTRGAIRTTRRWPATQLCDIATSNQPSIEPGGHRATEATIKWFPRPSFSRGGSATRPTTSPSSPSKAGGTRCQRPPPSRLSSSCGGSSAGRASSAAATLLLESLRFCVFRCMGSLCLF
jgi:hypothetical protein